MDTKATVTLHNGIRVSGRLTTAHAASSYGQPIFVDDDGQAYNWAEIKDINTAAEIGRKGGSVKSEKKARSSAENGKLGGRPKKKPDDQS